jgi:uncharacterized protein YqkB
LLLSFYILPAFAAVLKIRAKKLAQINTSSSSVDVVSSPASNSSFFENLSVKLNGISFFRSNIAGDSNASYNHIILKTDAYYNFNFLLLNEFKIITFFK